VSEKLDPAALEVLKRQLRSELRAELRQELRAEMKAELARLFQVFAHLVGQSAQADQDEPQGKGTGLAFRPRKTRPSRPPSASAQAAATKQLRKLGMLP
jgi:hypothetical protein